LSSPTPINLTPKETQQTIELLRACDTALGASENKTKLQHELINMQAAELGRADARQLQYEKDLQRAQTWNLLYFVGGMIVTGLTVRLVK
jgi:hypothetical protein